MISKLSGLSPLPPTNQRKPGAPTVEVDRFESAPAESGWKPWTALGLGLLGGLPGLTMAQPAQVQVQTTWTSPVRYPSQVTEALKPLQNEVLSRLQSARAERQAALAMPEGAERDSRLKQAQEKLLASLDMWQALFQVNNGLEQMSSDDPYVRWEGSPNLNEAEIALNRAAEHYHYFDAAGQKQLAQVHQLVNKLSWEDTFAPPGTQLVDSPWAQHATTQEMLQVLSDMNVVDGRAGNGGVEALAEATQELQQLRQQAWAMPHQTVAEREAREEKIGQVAKDAEAHRHRRNGAFQMHLQLQRLNTRE